MSAENGVAEINAVKFTVSPEKVSLNLHDGTTEKHGSRRYLLSRPYLICIIIFVVMCIGIIIVIFTKTSSSPKPNLCLSDECIRTAAAFKQTMNFEADPCDDFYEYVCGNWAEERPESESGSDWFRELDQKIYRNIRTQLERTVKRFDPKPVAQAKVVYQSCLNAGQSKNEAALEIVQILQELGLPRIPSLLNQSEPYAFDWIATVARIQRKLSLDVLVGFEITSDPKDSHLSRLSLHLDPIRKLNIDKDDDKIRNTTKLAQRFMKLSDAINEDFNSSMFESSFIILAEIYLNFLSDLPTEDHDQEHDALFYSVDELQRITDSFTPLNKSFPTWKRYFEELFAPFPEAQPTSKDKLLIDRKDVEYLKKFVKVMSQQDPQIVELFIWHRVTTHLTFHAFDEKKSKEICAKHVQSLMSFAVSYSISEENFLTSTKPRLEQMLANIREQFNQMVLETSWMDAKTKNATLEKSTAMKSFIGFPEWILDVERLEQYFDGLQITKKLYLRNLVSTLQFFQEKKLRTWRIQHETIWTSNPTKVNAFYSADKNAIILPVAIIQYPYYNLGLEALNYGAIGMVLGHELSHGFDDNGRFYDKFGNKKPWWSTRTHQEYEKRANCMVEQYSSYSLPEGSVNGTRTLAENIADNGGLREALRAYRAYVKRHGPEPSLPGFDGLSHDQLLFISFANLWCTTTSPEDTKWMLLNDLHSPGKIRVQGTLSNMPEFSEAFQCAPGKGMNPEKKCRVW